MHEITLCQRALELIEQQASAYGAKRVTAVWIKNWRIFLRGNQRSFLLF
ncbi:hydrogenase nickel incorporation protein [Salmonella enterica subsp. enterica]|nr:hydrogenase nickel incorporation protein [Salmonella enterica subsp. enterica]